MAKISQYPSGGAVQAIDNFVIARGGINYRIPGAVFMLPDGTMLNGKITPTVVANALILTLQTQAGATPSIASPVFIKIDGSWRTVTVALSVTVAAGANSFNSGSAEMATNEIDYFAYLAWKTATSAVALGFGRIPYAALYAGFSAVATNEKYGAFSSAPAATDVVTNIGRFSATLSAGAGYTWTVPAFTAGSLVQKPTYESRPLVWVPVWGGLLGLTYTAVSVAIAQYQIVGRQLKAFTRASGTVGGVAGTSITGTLPFNSSISAVASETANGAAEGVGGRHFVTAGPPDMMTFQRYDAVNFGAGAGKVVNGNFIYWIA